MNGLSRALLLCILTAFLFPGCSETGEPKRGGTTLPLMEDRFPEDVSLEFSPVSFLDVIEQTSEYEGELVASIPFGTFEGADVFLHVYNEAKSTTNWDVLRGVVEIGANRYLIPDQLSNSFLEEESEFTRDRLLSLHSDFPEEDGPFHLLGAVEAFSNGPGNMVYLLFDRKEGIWRGFTEWGFPYVHDLDGDGAAELVVEFPGLHLSPPNVVLFSFSEERRLETAWVVTDKLAGGHRMFAALNRDAEPWRIRIGTEREGEAEYVHEYRYEGGTLVRK